MNTEQIFRPTKYTGTSTVMVMCKHTCNYFLLFILRDSSTKIAAIYQGREFGYRHTSCFQMFHKQRLRSSMWSDSAVARNPHGCRYRVHSGLSNNPSVAGIRRCVQGEVQPQW